MDRDRVRALRDGLPNRLNAGILMGDGGFCILGTSGGLCSHTYTLAFGSSTCTGFTAK